MSKVEIGVSSKELNSAADAADSAIGQVSKIKLSTALADAATGMPGSQSATSISTVGKAWERQIAGWVRQADDYAKELRAAARNYTTTEHAISHHVKTIDQTEDH